MTADEFIECDDYLITGEGEIDTNTVNWRGATREECIREVMSHAFEIEDVDCDSDSDDDGSNGLPLTSSDALSKLDELQIVACQSDGARLVNCSYKYG